MKTTKKFLAITLALILVFCLSVTAFAAKVTTGKITVKNTTTDADYSVYKIFDATVSEKGDITYTYSGDLTGNAYFEKDSAGNVKAKEAALDADDPDKKTLNADAIKALAKLKGKNADATKKGNGAAITFTDLAFGYYYVESSVGAAVSVTSTTPTATIIDKNVSRPGPVDKDTEYKSIVSGENNLTETTATIGETVKFEVAFKALNFDTFNDEETGKPETKQIVKYVIEDVATGIKIDWDSLKIKVGTSEIAKTAYTLDKAKSTVTIAWANASTKATIYDSPVDVYLTYNAEVIAAGTDSNDIAISYVYDDGSDEDIKEPTPDTPSVEIKNYNIVIKNTEEDETTALPGATFKLLDKDGNEIKLVKESDGVYRVATPEEIATQGFKPAVIDAGTATVKGLKNGVYKVQQETAPDGYNKLTEPVSVTVKDKDAEAIVANSKGKPLPMTGSSASLVLILIGAITMLGAGMVLVTNKKMSKESI